MIIKELTITPRVGKRYMQLLENAIGEELTNSFKEIIMKYAGLAVLENTYRDKNNTIWEIQTFDHVASMVDLTKEFKRNGWGNKIPFAYDPGGWHFCLSFDLESFGKIIVNRWTDYSPEEQFVIIADDFESFINGLERRPEDLE